MSNEPVTKKESDSGSSDLLASSAAVGSMTMTSRVFGLIRDVVIARFIGASDAADAFFVAFRIPQFLRRLFAEGAFAQAFVPVLSEYREQRDFEQVKALVNAVCGVLGGTLIMIVGLVVAAAPLVTMVFAPGFIDQPDKFELTSSMLQITFPYLLLISLTGFAGAVLNSYDRFVVPAFTPVLLNLSLIGFALFVSPLMNQPVYALAWGVLFAGVLQLFFQLPFLARLQLLPRPTWNTQHEGVRKIMLLMLPAVFGVSVSQINLLLDSVLASLLPSGSVSWLYYSDRLAELPLGVFGIAIATVILPGLSRLSTADDPAKFKHTLDWALTCIVLVAIPAMAALVMLSGPILFTLFQYGATTIRDIAMSSASLSAYALGILAFMAIKVLAAGYFSRQDMRTPVRFGIIAMVANMVFNLIFVALFHFKWQMGHVGLALATSLSAYLNASLLFFGLKRHFGDSLLTQRFWISLVRVVFATVVMCGVLFSLAPAASFWEFASAWERIVEILLLCSAGLLVYAAALFAAGQRLGGLRSPT